MNLAELAERVATEQSLDKAQARKMSEAPPKVVIEVRPIPGGRPGVMDRGDGTRGQTSTVTGSAFATEQRLRAGA